MRVRGGRSSRAGWPAPDWGRAGFTIAELLIAMLLTGILMVTVFASMDSQRKSYTASEQNSDIGQNLRVAVETVTREVRLAGLRTAGGQPAIVQAAPFQLTFYADVNQSCLCGATGVRVAEDVCWGYPTSLSAGIDAPPTSCGLRSTNPLGDSPNGVHFFDAVNVVPSDATTTPSHAELVTWTFDRPANATTPGDAFPLPSGDDTIDSTDADLLVTDCGASAINKDDLDPTLSGTALDNPLYNLYRLVTLNRTSAVSTGNSTSVAKVAAGLRGPCDSANNPQSAALVDEVGNIWPAFSYWIDRNGDGEINNDCSGGNDATEDVLFGDADGDCLFNAGEFTALTAVPQSAGGSQEILANVIRVDVHLAGAAQDRAAVNTSTGGAVVQFRGKHLASSAIVRNRVR